MHELIITRNNHLVDPILHIWDWQIPVYLFLGGLVAGMMIISGYFILTGRAKDKNCSCHFIPIIGLVAISLGMFALFLDLEHKLYVWRMYATFQWTSPMSWGSWILLLVYPILIINTLLKVPENLSKMFPQLKIISAKLNSFTSFNKIFGSLSMIIGGVLGMYTGVLLSAFGARPAWNSSLLWVLFLTSGLSSAAALIHLLAKDKNESRMLAKADNGFLIAELLIILMMFVGFVSSSQIQIQAAQLFLNGPYTAVFWVFVVGFGILIPLMIQLMAVNDKIQHTPIAPIMVIIGGLILRFVIVSAGQFSSWSTAVLGK